MAAGVQGLHWMDMRDGVAALRLDDVWALIVNTRRRNMWNWVVNGGNHWTGLRCIDGVW